ncbi:MAG: acetylxylan esterase, partial [Bacteroidaceae bacterium]|nr:acetylxylan esterase [Bacteroidaceae bacterium]
SLFWAVTVIDCPEEMPNVRLAAGSNGASKWWLNGEEVLLLEGDRRMVEDDGMSARLTLRKGRNILRCAVINGPGLSDLCARFLDENNKPVTNYSIKLQ